MQRCRMSTPKKNLKQNHSVLYWRGFLQKEHWKMSVKKKHCCSKRQKYLIFYMQMQKGVHAHQNWERKQDSFTWAQHCQTNNVSVSTRARKCTETKKAKQSNKKENTNQTKVTYTPRSESLEVSIGQVFELRGSLDIPLPKVKKGKKKGKK